MYRFHHEGSDIAGTAGEAGNLKISLASRSFDCFAENMVAKITSDADKFMKFDETLLWRKAHDLLASCNLCWFASISALYIMSLFTIV